MEKPPTFAPRPLIFKLQQEVFNFNDICVSWSSPKTDLLPKVCNFIKNKTLAQVFSCGFCEISKNTVFTEHLWATASVILLYTKVRKPGNLIL